MVLAPPALQSLPPVPPAVARLATLLGVPYAEDAVTDAQGRWVTFAEPDRARAAPGINCSGFLVEAARRLWGFAGQPAEAARDRRGDSGPGAVAGQDWDFGLDLLLNLSDGQPRRWLVPEGPRTDLEVAPSGFPAQDAEAWRATFSRLRTGRVWLVDFLRPRPGGRPPLHHHVALLLREAGGVVWLYQTLPGGRVHRLALASPAGFARFRRMFGPAERVLLLEVDLPAAATSPDRRPGPPGAPPSSAP